MPKEVWDMSIKVLALVVLLLIASTASLGQRLLIVTGNVVDENGTPIAGANVCLRGEFDAIEVYTTGDDGFFRVIRNVKDSTDVFLFIEGPQPAGYWVPETTTYWSLGKLPEHKGTLLHRTDSGIVRIGNVKPNIAFRGVRIDLSKILGPNFVLSSNPLPQLRMDIYRGETVLASDFSVPTDAINEGVVQISLPNVELELVFTIIENDKSRKARIKVR
ncbi:MAG TPA: carboxypeptidase-like regulatory domain-containing protein [Pyrinomonadaceae bacterium]|nr:carboxypeptidase-like regulatory domain-containing protein [Pyrinomonadaceae bacterium]HRK51178.1 carboxypeptidase-like regulatory domain-containing protein [Pyrinomonadaceae bacterium]